MLKTIFVASTMILGIKSWVNLSEDLAEEKSQGGIIVKYELRNTFK